METEVKSFQSVLAELSCDAKLCYVIVSKRIMQRFFSKVRGGELQNPQPGKSRLASFIANARKGARIIKIPGVRSNLLITVKMVLNIVVFD